MTFAFSERHIQEYYVQGYTVFEQILPPSLVQDLRQVADQARQLARRERGPQTQRLQPLAAYQLDQQPLHDYAELPVLLDALQRVLTPDHAPGGPQVMGILFEPVEAAYCTPWHRDWRDNMPGLDIDRWQRDSGSIDLFNQVNCALYNDSCTWVVPGSHLRPDLPGEAALFPQRPIPGPDLEGCGPVERERRCLTYVRQMAGAVQLHLQSGDFALYRNSLWHLGNYTPHARRATLHDSVDTPAFVAWRQETQAQQAQQ
ncbi:MAG: hypothetical protein GKR89_15135 [Candidatus Latescibacteria bacterium]|nr:hypothetical protein [Candidatus Latescibacterota bacterium]